jgi:hypothetical protein
MSNEKFNGAVTPFGMEQQLKLKLKATVDMYENFLEQSEADLIEEETELVSLTQVLMKE